MGYLGIIESNGKSIICVFSVLTLIFFLTANIIKSIFWTSKQQYGIRNVINQRELVQSSSVTCCDDEGGEV